MDDMLGVDSMPSGYEDWTKVSTAPKRDWKAIREGTYFVVGFVSVILSILFYAYWISL